MLPPQPPTPDPLTAPPAAPSMPTAPEVATTKDGTFWRTQISAAIARRQRFEPWWEACLRAYAPFADKQQHPDRYGTDVRTNRTFTLVERKAADLFYRRPDLTLAPTPLDDLPIPGYTVPAPPQQPGQPPAPPMPVPATVALEAHEEILNEQLGERGLDATALMDRVVFDVTCTQGWGMTVLGYESYTKDTPHPTDPTQTVPVPVKQTVFWNHASGKTAVIPANFRSTEFDKAPFLGYQFELPLTDGNRVKYRLPADFQGSKPKPETHYDHGDSTDTTLGQDLFTGVILYYRSMLFRTDVVHPDHLTQLVLVDGIDEPVIEKDCPYQTLTPTGDLSPTSMIGFPIHFFATRSLTDSAYVASDSTMIRPLENELDIFRTQLVQARDATILRYVANGDVITPEIMNKIVRAPVGGIAILPGEAFSGEGAIKPLEGGSVPRESFQSNDYIDNDLARTTGIDSNGSGVQATSARTATSDQIVAANASARMDKERQTLLKQYIQGATKFSALLQQFLPIADAIRIVGPQKAQAWDAWRRQADSRCAFTAMPDSALRVDAAVDRKDAQDFYSFVANDPFVQKGRAKLLEKVFRKHHIDPTGIVLPPDPPSPHEPAISLAIQSPSLSPLAPEYGNVMQVLTQLGFKNLSQPSVDPQTAMAIQAANKSMSKAPPLTEHGGKLPPVESLDKHHADLTGGMQGLGGSAAPMAPGGHLQ
jgi:hypothetical protein